MAKGFSQEDLIDDLSYILSVNQHIVDGNIFVCNGYTAYRKEIRKGQSRFILEYGNEIVGSYVTSLYLIMRMREIHPLHEWKVES